MHEMQNRLNISDRRFHSFFLLGSLPQAQNNVQEISEQRKRKKKRGGPSAAADCSVDWQ